MRTKTFTLIVMLLYINGNTGTDFKSERYH